MSVVMIRIQVVRVTLRAIWKFNSIIYFKVQKFKIYCKIGVKNWVG